MQIISPTRRFEYVLEADRDSAKKTRFVLRRLSWEEMRAVQREAPIPAGEDAQRVYQLTAAAREQKRPLLPEEIAQLLREAPEWDAISDRVLDFHARLARLGLEKITGLLDEKGKPTKMAPEEFIRWSPPDIVHELGAEILRLSTLTEDDLKNLRAPPEPGA